MRAMLLTFLALALPALADIPPIKPSPALPTSHRISDPNAALESKGKKAGAWYFSAEGHAVFCYGPTMYIQTANGIARVATFCRGDRVVVTLHE